MNNNYEMVDFFASKSTQEFKENLKEGQKFEDIIRPKLEERFRNVCHIDEYSEKKRITINGKDYRIPDFLCFDDDGNTCYIETKCKGGTKGKGNNLGKFYLNIPKAEINNYLNVARAMGNKLMIVFAATRIKRVYVLNEEKLLKFDKSEEFLRKNSATEKETVLFYDTDKLEPWLGEDDIDWSLLPTPEQKNERKAI